MRKDRCVIELARPAFADHVVTTEGLGRWRCGRPDTSMYSFRVISVPGAVIVYGDLGERIFRHADSNSLEWLRGAVKSPEYLLGKASPPFKIELDEDHLEADLAEWVGEPQWSECLAWSFRMIGLFDKEWRSRMEDARKFVFGGDDVDVQREGTDAMEAVAEEEMPEFYYAYAGSSQGDLERRRVIAKKVWAEYERNCDDGVGADERHAWALAWLEAGSCEAPCGDEIYESQAWWHAEALKMFVALLAKRDEAQRVAPDVQHMAVIAREQVETLLTRVGI